MRFSKLGLLLAVGLLSVACSGLGPGSLAVPPLTPDGTLAPLPAETGTATRTVTPSATPTPTGAPSVLSTPSPPPTDTATPLPPTPTPEPTPTLEALRPLAVGLDVGEVEGPFDKTRLLNGSVGGYAPMSNFNWLAGALDDLTAIEMQMIRLDHLTDEALYRVVWRGGDGELRYDFSRLNRAVVPVLQSGMTPLMSLSYKPKVLEPKDAAGSVPPTDMNEWAQVVTTYVAHFKDLGYTGLYWEVWNEPDLGFFFQGGAQQYIDLYVTTAQAIKQVDPTAQVGGSADSSVVNAPEGKLQPLLTYIQAHPEVPLDFVSYHDYADPDGDGQPPFTLDWNAAVVEALLEETGLGPKPIFITEWHLTPNMTVGAGAASDTNVGAAAAAARLYNVLQYPDVRRTFLFSPIEGFVPDKIFAGDLGLLTVNGHRKALYNLFEMISQLGDTRLRTHVAGENTEAGASAALATLDSASGTTAVLVWNYWDQARTLELAVSGLSGPAQGRNLQVTHTLIDAEHGNYYHDYAAGLRGYAVGPSEALVPIESSVMAANDVFARRMALPPYSVVLVLLTPTELAPTRGPVLAPPEPAPFNYAAARPVAASASLDVPGWYGSALVDEIAHSLPTALGWSSQVVAAPEQEAWVQVDLGEAVTVDTVKLTPRDDFGYEGHGFPVDFRIQGAQEPDQWTDLAVHTGYDPGEPARRVQTFTFAPGSYRYIRVVATRLGAVSDEGYALQFAEMEVSLAE